MLRLGLLGYGFIARAHLAALAKIDDVQVVAIATAGSAVPGEYRHYLEPSDLIQAPDVDAVVVALPTDLHARYAIETLRAGKSVLIEKPVVRTMDEAARLASSIPSGAVAMVAHVLRHKPELTALAKLIDSGALGGIIGVHSHRRAATPGWSRWLSDPVRSGGALLDLLIHDFDIMNWLLGTPVSVTATGVKGPHGGWDYIDAGLRYADQARTAHVHGTNMLPKGYPFSTSLEVLGHAGAAEVVERHHGPQIDATATSSLVRYDSNGHSPLDVAPADPFDIQARVWVEAVRANRTPPDLSVREAAKALQVALAVERSLAESREVPVAEIKPSVDAHRSKKERR